MSAPPPLPAPGVRPHRAQLLVMLAALAFVFAPCGFVALLLARRDLRAMGAGAMDPAGEKLTRTSRVLALVASVVWAVKWAAVVCGGVVLYFNWDRVRPYFP
jgi:hypothetical protein